MRNVNLFSVRSGLLRGVKNGHGENDDYDDNKQYCQSCLQYGIRSRLKRRMYKVEVEQNQSIPKMVPANVLDADRFRQCHRCRDIVPVYNVKYESKIQDFVETVDNPFDIGKSFLGIDSRELRKRRQKQQTLDHIKEPYLKNELSKGSTLISYFES